MKLAVMGKGGSGKTTTAAVVARTLARGGHNVVALDCDTNPNLGLSLGLGDEATERLAAMRQALDEGGEPRSELGGPARPVRGRRPRRCPPGGGVPHRGPRTRLTVMRPVPRAVARDRRHR